MRQRSATPSPPSASPSKGLPVPSEQQRAAEAEAHNLTPPTAVTPRNKMHTADRQNLSGTPSWALFDSHGVGDSALLGQPLLSQSPPGGGEIPGSAVWTRHFAARGIDEETRHLDQLRNR